MIKNKCCEYCGKELKQGETVLCVDKNKFYCEDCYSKFTTYYFEDSELGNENDSEEVEYSKYQCNECEELIEEYDSYLVNNKLLCSYCAMKELGFNLIKGFWIKNDLKIEYSWGYLDEKGYSYKEDSNV